MDGLIHPVYGKAQGVRLIDVLALGPFMMWYGWNARGVPELARWVMVGSGLATILYNLANYQRINRLSPEEREQVELLASELRGKF